jgi:N-acetylmuramoyl-L-alanine amidase
MTPAVRKPPEWNPTTEQLTPVQVLALTCLHEAQPGSLDAMRDVGCVVRNRLATGRWGDSYKDVCLAPWQFSCWRIVGGPSNHERLMRHARILLDPNKVRPIPVVESLWIAEGIMTGMLFDTTQNATHYFAPALLKGKTPSWAKHQTPVAERFGHVFFAGIA